MQKISVPLTLHINTSKSFYLFAFTDILQFFFNLNCTLPYPSYSSTFSSSFLSLSLLFFILFHLFGIFHHPPNYILSIPMLSLSRDRHTHGTSNYHNFPMQPPFLLTSILPFPPTVISPLPRTFLPPRLVSLPRSQTLN